MVFYNVFLVWLFNLFSFFQRLLCAFSCIRRLAYFLGFKSMHARTQFRSSDKPVFTFRIDSQTLSIQTCCMDALVSQITLTNKMSHECWKAQTYFSSSQNIKISNDYRKDLYFWYRQISGLSDVKTHNRRSLQLVKYWVLYFNLDHLIDNLHLYLNWYWWSS